jgi:two-component system sensor histidine kinase MprB
VTFRVRLAVASAAAVALAVALAAPLVYLAVRSELRGQVDAALRDRAAAVSHQRLRSGLDENGNVVVALPPLRPGEVQDYVQYVTQGGEVRRPAAYGPGGGGFSTFQDVALPPAAGRAVAAGGADAVFSDAWVDGTHMRLISVRTMLPGLAVQVARPLTQVDAALARIRNVLLAVVLAGIGLASAFGLIVARTALAPVRRLTAATEHVTETGDLTERLDDRGHDELSRLGGSFNRMMEALQSSQRAQRQLVADASHELRTPLTSLRTNIEVLALDRELPEGEREKLLADVVEQLDEMTTLVAELVELARGEAQQAEPEPVRLDLLVEDAVVRARRNAPHVAFVTRLEETTVTGVPPQLERAVSNLLDNAAKWSPPGAKVEVSVAGGAVVVRDHGPGIEEGDLPHVFDRFYRAPAARGLPGSGLGLAIVKQVADRHGGSVAADLPEDGGTRMRLAIPVG